jgi:hypothetical protein
MAVDEWRFASELKESHKFMTAPHTAGIRALLKPLIVGGETAATDGILLELMAGLLAPANPRP